MRRKDGCGVKKMKPIDARSFQQICSLPIDCRESGDFWMQLEEDKVSIVQQKKGNKPMQEIDIPREIFDELCKWYVG